MRPRFTLPALVAVLLLPHADPALAQTFEEGNVLVSTREVLYEYTPDGMFVRSLPIPYPHPVTENARDVVAIHPGLVAVFNGTFDPYVSFWDADTEAWTHRTHVGWSTANNVSYGGIGATERYLFVTDQRTYGNGGADEAKGIVRFDLESQAAVRFAEDIEPIDLAVGLDGMLYALYPGGSPSGRFIDVYDPETLAFARTINLSAIFGHTGHRAIAVNAQGDVFIADWDGDLQKIDAAGNVLLETNICSVAASCSLFDIDLSTEGVIVIGDRFGGVTLTDEQFASPTSFRVGTWGTFVAIVPFRLIPPAIVHEDPLNPQGCLEATGPDGATVRLRAENRNTDPVEYAWYASAGAGGNEEAFSFDAQLNESVEVTLTLTEVATGYTASVTLDVCVSDTTSPVITFLSPREGDSIVGNNLAVAVKIDDVVDLSIEEFDLFVGQTTTLPYRSQPQSVSVRAFKPGRGSPTEVEVAVRAVDQSGNVGRESVFIRLLHDRGK